MYRPKIMLLPLCFMLVLFMLSPETRTVKAASATLATARAACGSWKVVPSPSPGSNSQDLSGVAALSSHAVSAVGYQDTQDLTEQWNGTRWSVIRSPGPGKGGNVLNGVALVPGSSQLWAVGYFYKLAGYRFTLTKRWNGTTWVTVGSPNPNKGKGDNELDGVTAISATDVWAVGDAENASNAQNTLAEHWNGTQWSIITSPNPGGDAGAPHYLYAVAAVSTTDVWAVGSDLNASNETQTLILHWDGTSWSVVQSPDASSIDNYLFGVAAVSANNIWAVGDYTTPGILEQTLVEHWNGTSWSVVQSPNVGEANILTAVANVPGTRELWAVGSYGNPGSTLQTLTEHYC